MSIKSIVSVNDWFAAYGKGEEVSYYPIAVWALVYNEMERTDKVVGLIGDFEEGLSLAEDIKIDDKDFIYYCNREEKLKYESEHSAEKKKKNNNK